MKRLLIRISILLLFCFSCASSFSQKVVHRYINKFKPLAVDLMHEYDIPASVILGVAITESGAGTSLVCKKLHNHFGIVGKNKDSIKKLGYKSKYKQYPNDTASYKHFCKVIKKKRLYTTLKGSKDYELWVNTINKQGYASAKLVWVNKVISTIRKYKLDELDEE